MKRRILRALLFLTMFGSQAAHPAVVVVSVTGTTIPNTFVNLSGQLTGADSGGGFALEYRFDTDPAMAQVAFIDLAGDDVGYEFAGGAYGVSGTIGSLPVSFQRINAGLADNENLTSLEAPPSVTPGVYDGFALAGQSDDGNFNMATGILTQGHLLGIALYGPTDTYGDAAWLDASSFKNPPALGPGIGTYMSYGVMSGGVPSAFIEGTIDTLSVQIVPLPAAAWLMASVLPGLIGFRRRRTWPG